MKISEIIKVKNGERVGGKKDIMQVMQDIADGKYKAPSKSAPRKAVGGKTKTFPQTAPEVGDKVVIVHGDRIVSQGKVTDVDDDLMTIQCDFDEEYRDRKGRPLYCPPGSEWKYFDEVEMHETH